MANPMVADEPTKYESFTLRVLSPSDGATVPLSLQMTMTNTVRDLKEKIRFALPMRPSDEHQRLIYRGRRLQSEDETMEGIFGKDILKNQEVQTIHLVLSLSEAAASNSASQRVLAGEIGLRPHTASATHGPGPAFTRPQQGIDTPLDGPVSQQPSNSAPEFRERLAAASQHLRDSFERLGVDVDHRHARHAQLVQQQGAFIPEQFARQRAAGSGFQPSSNITYTQSEAGPSGERWRTTVTTTTTVTVVPPGDHTVQAILAAAEQGRIAGNREVVAPVTRTVPSAVEADPRNSSGTTEVSPRVPIPGSDASVSQQPIRGPSSMSLNESGLSNPVATFSEQPPPVTMISSANGAVSGDMSRPRLGEAISSAPSLNSTPIMTFQASQLSSNAGLSSVTSDVSGGATVYILSSPSGPQALLIAPSQDGSENFFTLQRSAQNLSHRSQHLQDQDVTNRRDRRRPRHMRQNHPPAAPMDEGRVAHLGHPHNPNAAALMAQVWPHIWLLARLLMFVWFFTSSNNSWWRTILVSGIAFIVFLYNTGIFNDVAAQAWDPIRGHLEALLPLAAPEPAPVPAPAPVIGDNANPPVGEAETPGRVAPPRTPTPDPAQVAARLLEERRRADGNWLWTQIRRVEHATLLFLASLIPGVGERHIAARAAEDNMVMEADRQREAALAAAVVAANTEAEGDFAQGEPDRNMAGENDENGGDPVHREDNIEVNDGSQAERLVDV